MTYCEKLKDPRWQKKRLSVLQRENFTCQDCGTKEKTLHVHHFRYGKEPWTDLENEDIYLKVLCEDCHKNETEITNQIKAYLSSLQAQFGSKIVLDYIMDMV